MKEFFESFFKTTEERLKNPFIGAFSTAWLLFNWKSVLLLLLSTKDIEDKIILIENNMSNIWTPLILPLLSALFYTSILPYINLGIDETLKFSTNRRILNLINKRIKNIDNQKVIAIKEIELEDTKIEYRERKQKNNLIEELQHKVIKYEDEIESNRIAATQNIDSLKNSLREQDENYAKELAKYETIIKTIREEKDEALVSIQNLRSEIELTKSIIDDNGSDIISLRSEINSKDQKISELIKNLAIYEDKNKPKRLIYKFSNGAELYEQSDGNRTIYIDRHNSRVYDENDFESLKSGYSLDKFYE